MSVRSVWNKYTHQNKLPPDHVDTDYHWDQPKAHQSHLQEAVSVQKVAGDGVGANGQRTLQHAINHCIPAHSFACAAFSNKTSQSALQSSQPAAHIEEVSMVVCQHT